LSQHPVDRLIRELIHAGRKATPDEVARIIERMAAAPFDPDDKRVRIRHRELAYLGRTLAARADSLTYHLVQRIVGDAQWAFGTTAADYLADLRRSTEDPTARLVLYERRGGAIAATLTPTDQVLPPERRGQGWLPNVLVIYSADRAIIVSGYQISERVAASIPGNARWLK
jgi:hypothetical protein